MKKLKEFWGNNKVLIVLGLILVVCLCLICAVIFSYFLGGNYEAPSDYNFKSDEYITTLKEEKNVSDTSIFVKENIIYVMIKFVGNTSLEEAKGIAVKSLEYIGEDALNSCDISFILKSDATDDTDGFTIMGAKNIAGTNLEWNNNTPVESEEK